MIRSDLQRVSSATPSSDQAQLEQLVQYQVQLGSEYLQGWRLSNPSEQPAPVFDHLHSKNVFSCI